MKLSTKGRYAVMAMVDLAQTSPDRPVPLGDIASRQEISLSYLEQLFAKLRRSHLVTSVRGPGGGYQLARNPKDIHISDIMVSVEEPVDVTRCKNQTRGCMESGQRCITHDLWDALGQHIHQFLGEISLDDVLQRRILVMTPQKTDMQNNYPMSMETAAE